MLHIHKTQIIPARIMAPRSVGPAGCGNGLFTNFLGNHGSASGRRPSGSFFLATAVHIVVLVSNVFVLAFTAIELISLSVV